MIDFADELCAYIQTFYEVRHCRLYGSLAEGTCDRYSDIDIEVDVSGHDNAVFAKKLPLLLSLKYRIIFFDYAPSLAPEKYVVTVAMNEENPFMLADFYCRAVPHCPSLSKQDLASMNRVYDHMLKLFSANVKHFFRGEKCRPDIVKMYRRIFGTGGAAQPRDEKQMLRLIYLWLIKNAGTRQKNYVAAFGNYIREQLNGRPQ